MGNRNTKIAAFDDDLSRAFQEVCPLAVQVAVIGMAQRLAYEWETKRLREILSREPTFLERFRYQDYFKAYRLVKQQRKQIQDDRKLRDAAWLDAGMLE